MGAIPGVGEHTEKILKEFGITLWIKVRAATETPNA
jgi:hypothetical protein